jgi:sulfur-oxidizing protein SoxY
VHRYRRRIVQASAALAVGAPLASLRPGHAQPIQLGDWNRAGFEARALADALRSIGAAQAARSEQIAIRAPDLAENGARIQVEVTSRIPDTRAIALVVDRNPFPLTAVFEFEGGAEPYLSTFIKMEQTSDLRAIVNAGGRLFFAAKEVRVTIGGCGV